MELVYLWVDNYKNIYEQGFVFSPYFEFEFEDYELITCEKKKKKCKDFFGKNISITAIVGKNGTGKSALLKAFLERFIDASQSETSNESQLFYFDKKILELSKKNNKDIFVVYWDYSITDESFQNIDIEDSNDFYQFDTERAYLLQPAKIDLSDESNIDIKSDIQNLAFNMIQNNFLFVKDFFMPTHILIKTGENLNQEFNDEREEAYDYFYKYHKDKYEEKGQDCYKYTIDDTYILDKIKNNEISRENALIDLVRDYNHSLLFLSFGEIQLLKILYNIHSLVKNIQNSEYKSIIFLLDELELGLHPEWQKKVISFLTMIESKIPIHFILTTHSPFIISDLPKQNVIFLDKYKEEDEAVKNGKQEVGNCKVLSHDEVLSKKQTFGANIHTLLSDSFFMKDGLMGEFAKGKITEIKYFYEKVLKEKKTDENIDFYNKNKTKFEEIQSIIGEPFLKTVIKNYLDEIESILFDDAKVKKMAIKRFIDEFDKDDIMKVLNDKS